MHWAEKNHKAKVVLRMIKHQFALQKEMQHLWSYQLEPLQLMELTKAKVTLPGLRLMV